MNRKSLKRDILARSPIDLYHFFVLVHLRSKALNKRLQFIHNQLGRQPHASGQSVSFFNEPWTMGNIRTPLYSFASKLSFECCELPKALSDVANFCDQMCRKEVKERPCFFQL